MAEIQPLAPAAPVSFEAMPIDAARSKTPTNSDKLLITPVRPTLMGGNPISRRAIFSTDHGRQPAREPPGPPYPPVLARSHKVLGVVHFANFWRNKYPRYYHCLFPQAGWTITDLWDNADIHLHSPGFLEEVLQFITRDNVHRARAFSIAWSKENPDKLNAIACNTPKIYATNDPLAIVDKVFVNGESTEYPHEFLWHVLNMMRTSMLTVAQNELKQATVNGQRMVKADGTDLGSMGPTSPTTTHKSIINAEVKQPSHSYDLHPVPNELSQMPTDTATPATTVTAVASSALIQAPSFAPSLQPKNYLNQPLAPSMSEPTTMLPQYPNGQLRNPKSRAGRSASGAYSHPPQSYGWVDNTRMPSGQHFRQPSGPMTVSQASRYVTPMPMGPGMMNSLGPMAQFPQNTPMGSPPMHPAQNPFPPMIQQGVVSQYPAQFVPHAYDQDFQPFGFNGPGPRAPPFGDMTNSVQYPVARGTDTRGGMVRRSSHANKPTAGLYNPYGAERPDKADFAMIPSQPTGRKASRNSFSYTTSKSRKFSGGYGASNYERDDMRRNGNYGDALHPRVTYSQVNPDVINDKEYGCDVDWIGPKNTTVCELHIKNMPSNVTSGEISNLFSAYGEVSEVVLKHNPISGQATHAFVHFSGAAEAKKSLKANGALLRSRSIAVSVPNRYYKLPDPPLSSWEPQASFSHSHNLTRVPFKGARDTSNNELEPIISVQYSPQDARSDLHRTDKQQYRECITTFGSPEERKSRKHVSPDKKAESKQVDHPHIEEAMNVADKPYVVVKPSPSVKAMGDPQLSKQNLNTINKDFIESSKQDVAAEVNVATSPKLDHSEDELEKISASPTPNTPKQPLIDAKATAESVPVDSYVSPLTSSTKVILPPQMGSPTKNSDTTQNSQVMSTRTEQAKIILLEGATVTPHMREEAASDDDQKNDLSFHSAQESQSNLGNSENKDDMDISIDIGQALAIPIVNSAPIQADPKAVPSPTKDIHQSVETKTVQLSIDTSKKSGAKQTESLFPFAKPSKSQAKKERQAKKKDKKKAKVEKLTSTTPTMKVEDIPISEHRPRLNSEFKDYEAQSPKHARKTVATKAELYENKCAKSIGPVTSEDTLTTTDNNESTYRDGKHFLSLANNVPVTQKLEAQQPIIAQNAKQALSQDTSSPELSVLCRRESPASAMISASSAPHSVPFVALQKVESTQQPAKKTKASLDKIAVPDLCHLARKASPVSGASRYGAASSEHSTSSGVASPTKSTKNVSKDFEGGEGSIRTTDTHDAASVASSTTIRNPSPPPMSASPTILQFYTPLQTPSALASPPLAASQKKKGKRKKKALSRSADIPEEVPTTENEVEEPFHDQLCQIAGVKSSSQSISYYFRSNQEPEETRTAGEKEQRSLIRKVHAYVLEKTSTYARLPNGSWCSEERQPAPKISHEELSQRLLNEEAPLSADALIQDGYGPKRDLYKVQHAGAKLYFK